MATQTSTIVSGGAPATRILKLDSGYGSLEREISTAPLRDCTQEEINVIDVAGIYGDLNDRKAVAAKIKHSAENSGFFYIKNHGIDESIIAGAYENALRFMNQPDSDKKKVSNDKYKYFNGWAQRGSTRGNRTEPKDLKEHFSFQYDPKWDPWYDGVEDPTTHVPEKYQSGIHAEDVWSGTSQLAGFREASVAYARATVDLGRRLLKIFALALDLEETYFDHLVTYPNFSVTYNFYPPAGQGDSKGLDIGLGSHTDIQLFTMLWQDTIGGLNVLNQKSEWVRAVPVPGTFVVNIADFLTRLTNGRWLSTVHQVSVNTSDKERVSMPVFFGLNTNEKVGVLPSCTSESEPPKFEPLSTGEWIKIRMSVYEKPKEY